MYCNSTYVNMCRKVPNGFDYNKLNLVFFYCGKSTYTQRKWPVSINFLQYPPVSCFLVVEEISSVCSVSNASETIVLNLRWSEIFSGCPQSIQMNAGIVTQNGPFLFTAYNHHLSSSSKSLLIQHCEKAYCQHLYLLIHKILVITVQNVEPFISQDMCRKSRHFIIVFQSINYWLCKGTLQSCNWY